MPDARERAEKAYPAFALGSEELVDDEVLALRRGYERGWNEREREPREVTDETVTRALEAFDDHLCGNDFTSDFLGMRAAPERKA